MSTSWDFDALKRRIQTIAELAREGTLAEAPAAYHRGLDTELKALRAWVDVDREERGVAEIAELRELVATLDQRVSEMHASGGDARAESATRPSPPASWRA